jgi:uncharacterized protein
MDILALLFPREKKFYRMIEEQVSLVGDAVKSFHTLIHSYEKLNPKARKKLVTAITDNEKKDDVLYTRMVRALKSTFITPMDREDLHQLAANFDTVIDTIELLTLKFNAYNIKKIDKNLKLQVDLFYKAYFLVEKLIISIRKESEVEKHCLAVRKLEQEGDCTYIQAVTKLFSDSQTPVSIIKQQDLYASMEKLIDRIHETAMIIENIAIKYS